MSSEKELLIFGLDGATYDLLDTWFENGRLSFLEEIVENGVKSDMESTIPPLTSPAWTTFQTGVNPGKHGVFDWGSSGELDYGRGMIDTSAIKTKTIWELLSEQDKKVGSIGLPVTYPPKEVNGFITTGVLTPKVADDYIYPPELREGLEGKIGRYRFAPTHAEMALNSSKWIEELKKSINNREETALHLLETQEWDVSLVYFMETDTVNHHLYHRNTGDTVNNANENMDEDPVLEVYERVEQAVKTITEAVGDENTNIMLVSDHGFGPLEWIFNVNSWLLKKGYLKLKESTSVKIKRLAGKLGFNQKNMYKIGDLLGPLARGNEWEMEGFDDILGKIFLSLNDVDWKNTKAYSRGGVTGALRLNIKEREKHGCIEPEEAEDLREEIMAELSDLTNPYTGEPVIETVMKKEDVYGGPWTSLGPDILFLTKDMKTDTGGLTLFKTMDSVIPAFAISGTHRMNGIFAGRGPKFNRGTKLDEMSIVDPASIILYLSGLEVPSYMDGELQEEAFAEKYWTENPPRYVDAKLPGVKGKKNENKDDEEIRERLKSLGYLA
ncbi:MAG: alkaline phosphatase family protein [Candidatus Bipolaricaulota bacterium]